MSTAPDRRLLLVHAHPDDESINNGATMAKYAAEGAQVTLVTCTLGEEGEVIPPDLAHLAPRSRSEGGAAVPNGAGTTSRLRWAGTAWPNSPHAMRELGVTDHRFLGGPGRYRDSGMMGLSAERPSRQLLAGAAWTKRPLHLVPVIREVRPQVLVTYDPDGGYGHPDHIQAHRVAMRAAELAAEPGRRARGGRAARRAADLLELRAAQGSRRGLRPASYGERDFPFPAMAEPADVPGVVDDEAVVDVVIDGRAYAEAKARCDACARDADHRCRRLLRPLQRPWTAV